jgi:microcystin-dependent protein
MDYFLGEIRPFAFGFAPNGWAQCNGQLLQVGQFPALFSLLGAQFGGNGNSTFALPNIQGQVVVGQGQSTAGSNYVMGQGGGVNSVTLTLDQIPNHNHTFNGVVGTTPAITGAAATNAPATNGTSYLSNAFAKTTTATAPSGLYSHNPVNTQLNPNMIVPAGGGQSHENRAPFLVINYCINIIGGEYPSRD